MSKYRIGIIAEGPTDISVIQAIIKNAFPDKVFLFVPISPTPQELSMQKKDESFGWGGVYRVCKNLHDKLQIAEGAGGKFDCIVVHVDADIAYAKYGDIGELNPVIDNLPCGKIKESYDEVCVKLEKILLDWIGEKRDDIAPCIPYICTETWVGCWLFPEQRESVAEDTEEHAIYDLLYKLGIGKAQKNKRIIRKSEGRFRKCPNGYNNAAKLLSDKGWYMLANKYTQVRRFNEKNEGNYNLIFFILKFVVYNKDGNVVMLRLLNKLDD
ncbi:hypothetical protein SAMN05216582_10790 [Selenomonas ruminantium]|uniref:DUF4276 family protein n=1 Tax=Selenomonas ruminantium TaxID=971 RepID=A0A1M6TEJ7_SELRU|nr:hypothetical protein [Selenomonas ruminantium]SHK55452.1 hypothetical protein SAMN05216582_10790 [Selenomonas ruminantium]